MTISAHPQLLLGLGFSKEHWFDNYWADPSDNIADKLRRALFDRAEAIVYLLGEPESGKTHLCIAAYNYALQQGLNAYYCSCSDLKKTITGGEFSNYLDHLKGYDLLVLDDIACLAGDAEYEVSLFSLYNHFREHDGMLLVSAADIPTALNFSLPDLVSRFQASLILKVQALTDESKRDALVRSAQERGISLSNDVVSYIYTRSSRDLGALLAALDKLDHAQLVEKRSLTVPFVKKVMGW